ncbi:hypothetical protein CHS0354_025710 [Potamilus streckersoni]|uniref:Major facilitator superfamily (MFS) profile domain-containing protein n=1 Tax=Potamilus streckersoni TaxID=2493646 RepID=A0AAE0S158_9BIVA|nr:hypothetical protein CHS0354_025710 [Potamilus streckersoni]
MAEEFISETTPLLEPHSDSPTELLSHDTKKKDEFSWKKITRRQKFIFICMGFINFGACTCFSLLAPFFPTEAQKKGATPTEVGLIFGVFQLVIFVSSPVFGNFITKIGAKFMFVTGIMVCGSCAILFGNLNAGPDGTTFVVMCFVVRSVEALGCSAFVTSLFAIVAYEFPAYSTTVIGSLETFSGLGLMVGPPLGGALYELGGFGLPFFVLGSVVIVTGLSVAAVMPSIDQGHKLYDGSILNLLKSPLVLVTLLVIMTCSSTLGFMDPTLADHLAQFQLKTWIVGFIFLIAPAVYAMTAPLWGWLGDTKGLTFWMIGIGTFFSAFNLLLLGPAPFLPFIPENLGMPEDLNTYGKVSGMFNSCFSLGAFVGPTAGGVLVQYFGFPWAASVFAALFAFSGLGVTKLSKALSVTDHCHLTCLRGFESRIRRMWICEKACQ